MRRHTEAWRDSLRYGQPDLDRMSGLRRINLNNNPLIGNQGAQVLAEALKDDLWVKALDMQGTGVSTAGAKSFLDVLKYNTTLVVLDLRRNPLIDRNILHSLMEQLMINCNGQETEYQWIEPEPDEQPKQQKSKQRKTTKVLNSSMGKKTTIKITPSSARRRTRSAGALAVSRQTQLEKMKPTPGLPWRTAARANRYRGFPPERPPRKLTEDFSEADSTSVLITHEDSYIDPSMDTLAEMKQMDESRLQAEDRKGVKELQVELEQLRWTLRDERIARSKADQKVMQLMLENKRLEDDLRVAKLRSSVSTGRKESPNLQDESVLESIESSFKQFHSFLDMLREAGLGELITMAGLDQEHMPFSGNRTFNKSGLELPPSVSASFANSFRLQQAKGNGVAADSSLTSLDGNDPVLLTGNDRRALLGNKHRPANSRSMANGDGAHTMSHIDDSAYLVEKQAADEVYQRLLRQTSGAFTGGVSSGGGITSQRPSQGNGSVPVGKISAAPKEKVGEVLTEQKPAAYTFTPREDDLSAVVESPSDPLSGRRRDPASTVDMDKALRSPDDTLDAPTPRPVPTPRQKNAQGPNKTEEQEKADGAESGLDRRIPSRASEANYSMDSFEQSYISERGEVVVLGEDADLLDSPNSRPLNYDSDDGDF
ncbi:hypothetical protein BaRGS_00018811 [Batillaria attramentaria]|uniref:Centrosomal protein of 78 kDa n=1 Tax=Batillaria attramentaria TaxID=370345 RepID=A0ABD0KS72_9CAEN